MRATQKMRSDDIMAITPQFAVEFAAMSSRWSHQAGAPLAAIQAVMMSGLSFNPVGWLPDLLAAIVDKAWLRRSSSESYAALGYQRVP